MRNTSFNLRSRTVFSLTLAFISGGLMLLMAACQTKHREPPTVTTSKSSTQTDEAASRAAFLAAYQVLMHPRCMNCHPKGDQPLQGNDSHIHFQNVQRGPDGKGLFAMKCRNCHQDKNLPGVDMPPGHPEWHLPPTSARMVFEGKSPAELARQLKDPKQNGGKTLEQIVHHSAEDSLVATGWHPGPGRGTPPLTQAEFGRKMREWVDKGAAIP
jgi:cytochrome c5